MKEKIKKGNDIKVSIYSKFMKKITAITTIIAFIFTLLPAQMVFALNGSGNNPLDYMGYRIISSTEICVWTDKPIATTVSTNQFKLFKGTSSATGTPVAISSASNSIDTVNATSNNTTYTGKSSGGGVTISVGSTDAFVPGETYTLVVNGSIVAKNTHSLWHFSKNSGFEFNFTMPDNTNTISNTQLNCQEQYTSSANVEPLVSSWLTSPGKNENVPLESNIWLSFNMPVMKIGEVALSTSLTNGINTNNTAAGGTNLNTIAQALKVYKNVDGSWVEVTYNPFTSGGTNSQASPNADKNELGSPVISDDNTCINIPMSAGGSAISYNFAYNTTYKVSLPQLTFINGKTMNAQDFTFTTAPALTPADMVAVNPTATADGSNIAISWPTQNASSNVSYTQIGSKAYTNIPAFAKPSGYNLYYSKDMYWDFKLLNTEGPVSPGDTTSLYSFDPTAKGLDPNTTYYFRVSSVNNTNPDDNTLSNGLSEGGMSLSCSFIPVSSVTLDKTSDTLTVGYTDQLTAAVAPDNATNKSVVWASDNTAVATVSDTGLVTAVSAGTANITVTTADNSKTATCAVTVVTPAAFVSAATNTYGNQVQIKFSKEMATPLPTAPAGFKLTVDGVETTIKSIYLNSDKTKINLGLPIGVSLSNGQTITVSYTAGTVKATDGGVLESFDAQPVSNVISPVFVSASTDAAGTNVALKFNAKMSLPDSPAGFTIKADGTPVQISEVKQDIDPTILNFSLSSPVTFGQIVTIAYDGTGTAKDVNLVPLVLLGNFGVMNNVPQAAPIVESAVTSGPNHVILTMATPLRGTTGDPSAFTIAGAASNPNVTSAAVSGDKVILTLDNAIAGGETITVSYTKTGTNNLTNGAEADNFNQAVTNNIIAGAAAPTIIRAATNITGRVITVTFSKAMAVLPDGLAGFAVYVNGVGDAVTAAYLNSDPTKINLTLSTPVLYGQLVILTYTPGTVKAADGGVLAGVNIRSNQTVLNGTLANGVISTFAGSYIFPLGYAGNDVSATDSTVKLNYPSGMTVDGSGNIYFADSSNKLVREIAATNHAQFGISMTAGNIYTVAGNGTQGTFGDGNIATSANLYGPTSVAIDSEGNLYIADSSRIRKVDVNGFITNFAGDANGKTGYSADGGSAVNALFKSITDITVDGSGNIYITDSGNYVVRKIDKNGIITTVAGNGTQGSLSTDILTNNPDNPTLATNTPLNNPASIKVDAYGNIYLTDMVNQVALEIPAADHAQFGISMTAGNIYNIAGNGKFGDTGIGGKATSASISYPSSIAIDNAGNVFISESTSQYIKRVNADGIISLVAGMGSRPGYSPDNTLATSANLNGIRKLALDSDGNLLFSETNLIRILHPDTSAPVITLVGNPTVNIANGAIYTDEGISVTDSNGTGIKTITTFTKDGIQVGSINTNIAGIYIIHYNASDASYNVAEEVTRTVIVAPAAPNVTADDTLNKIVGIDSTMEYSFDNATWTNYLSNPNPDLSGDLTVYVRVAADSITGLPAGAVTTLSFKVNPTFTVTYNGNGNISGVVPVDTGSYLEGATATVLDNTNDLSSTGYTFAGWNTKADGSGTDYMPGTTLTMGTENITLYAKWITNPSIPASVNATSASYNSIKVSWGAVTGASGYEVFRAASSTGTYSLIATTTSLSYINSGLTTNSTYYYKVIAYKVVGTVKAYSSYSAAVSTKPIPSAPAAVKAASASYNSIKVSWGAVAGASGYQIFRATSSTGAYSLLTTTTSLSCINSGLTTGTTYFYKVRAYRTVGTIKVYSGYSAIVNSKAIPSAPANLKAVRYSSTSIKLTWSGVTGASGYVVYRATSSTGTYSLIKTTSYLSYRNTYLTRYRTYYYKIRAYRTVGTTRIYSNWSAVVSARPY